MVISSRESTAVVLRRCLAMLHRLQQGPAGKIELISAAQTSVDLETVPDNLPAKALNKQFEADKKRLQDWFGVDLRYQRAGNVYTIEKIWEPLLDLPDKSIEAIAFLQTTFSPAAPLSEHVQDLLAILQSYLPAPRQRRLIQQRTALEVSWGQRDSSTLDPQLEEHLNRALQRHLIIFDYQSPAQKDGYPRRHTAEPWQKFFDSARGHYYLRGYCRKTDSPAGSYEQNRYFYYRLDRIHNLEVLPQRLPPLPPPARKEKFNYLLLPDVARLGDVSALPGVTITGTELQADGSIIVHAETDEVWWAARSLLHYGGKCRVLEGSPVYEEMRRIAKDMAQIYKLVGE